MNRWLLLSVATVPLLLSSFRTPAPGLVWWTTHALDKVRPLNSVPIETRKSVSISAARNEFEPFQLVLRAQSQNIDDVDVDISDFSGPQGGVISRQNVTIYFERSIDLKQPSTIEASAGEWPDALIPRVDRYAGERRNAFPFKLADGRNQAFWVEVYVPPSASPGAYHAEMQVTVREKRQFTIPVDLQVWNFSIPSTSSLPNTYGFSGISAIRQHFGRYTNDADVRLITYGYQKAALWHRISLHGGSMNPPPFSLSGNQMKIDWGEYDKEMAPFLDGTAIRDGEPLFGARATSADIRTNSDAATEEQKILYWRQFARHFREKGWFDRLFNYVWDEPVRKDSAAVLRKAKLMHSADPEIRNLVTASFDPSWSGEIEIWSPLINCFELRSGFGPFCETMAKRSAYEPEIQKGNRLWWYQSCASHGCNIIGGAYFTGWPSYMIDISPVANRIMQWMTWKYSIQGELYFSTVDAYNRNEPWRDVNRYGGNGDGTLFYPGRPDLIGGKTHIPIESIRLKLIREGLEDYEYMHLLAEAGRRPFANEVVDRIVRKTFEFDHDPAKLYDARRRMGEELGKKE